MSILQCISFGTNVCVYLLNNIEERELTDNFTFPDNLSFIGILLIFVL